MKLLVTRPLPEPVMQAARARFQVTARESTLPLSPDELCTSLRDFDLVLPTLGDLYSAQVFADVAKPRASLLANFGVGFNHIDVTAARTAGVAVSNTPGAVTDATADIAMTLILMTARRAGEGEPFRLGEISGVPGHEPLEGEFAVERLGDGKFTCTGPMFHGFRMDLGPMALLRRGNVRVVLASVKCQAGDQAMFRHVGVEPRNERVLALKSSVHFRADFEPFAREVLVVAAPGPARADPATFAWTRLRPGLRLNPTGPAFAPAP